MTRVLSYAASIVTFSLTLMVVAVMLAGCGSKTTDANVSQQQTLYGIEQVYTDAAHHEVALITTHKLDPSTVERIKAADLTAHSAIAKLRVAVQNGQVLTGTDIASVQAEVDAYVTLVTQLAGAK